MSDLTELKSIAEEGNRAIAELREKAASKEDIKDVVRAEEVKRIQSDLAEKLANEEKARNDLAARLDAMETAANRPAQGGGGVRSEEEKAFLAYLRKGDESGLDQKSMDTQSGQDGGYAITPTMRDGIQARLRRSSPVRSVANVVTVGGAGYDILVERGDVGFEWAGETDARSETATPTINRISIALHELSAMPKVSQRLLDDPEFDVEAFVTARVQDRFARAEATAFVSGDGANKPKGFLSYPTAATDDAGRASATLQHVASGKSADFADTNEADVFVKLFYELQPDYQANATWMMRHTTAALVATLKDGDGRYVLDGMMNAEGQFVRRIMGAPLALAADMPALGAGSLSIAVGDFRAGYTIAQGPSIRVLRDPFSAKPFVLFYTTMRVGGGVSDFDAIKLMKFATS